MHSAFELPGSQGKGPMTLELFSVGKVMPFVLKVFE